MPFGLCNAPSTFQRLVNAMFAGMRGLDLQTFIDDICLASNSWEEHITMIDKVLGIVEKSKLKLKSSKCLFGAKRVLFLGHVTSEVGVQQDPDKTKALTSLPPPKDVAGVRRILGMAGYYRRFVPRFSEIVEPITRLLRKDTRFHWNSEQVNALDKLFESLKKNLILSHYNHLDPIMLKTDARKLGIAGMLFQKQSDEWKLITCCSRQLSDSEKNYGITDLECLAIIYSVTKLRNYLLGRPFVVKTDHSALKILNSVGI